MSGFSASKRLISVVRMPHSPSAAATSTLCAVDRAAFAEEALDEDFGALVAAAAADAASKASEQDGEPPHRTAGPAIARTICFWKTM